MGLFGNKNKIEKHEGGMMDAIRCDETEYLIWKWQPAGATDTTKKENAIRWGSSLRVKDGETAVFVYRQKDGTMQDFIEGPFDETIKTANFPVLSSIVGAAFGGGTPFQAEVYYINTAGILQIKFAVPYFDVFDPRFNDYSVPVSVHGALSFKITDAREFVKLHRLASFDMEQFKTQISDSMKKYVKGVVTNAPSDNQIIVTQMDRKILQISDLIEQYIKPRFQNDFGVTVSAVDISTIDIDKSSSGYKELMSLTKDMQTETMKTQQALNLDTMKTQQNLQMQNLRDTQRINTQNMEETLKVQREEAQYAQHMTTDMQGFALHQLNAQKDVSIAGANALGQMNASGATSVGGNGAINPAGMMAGIAMGGQIAQGMNNMMGNMMGGMQMQGGMTPPPIGAPVPPPIPGDKKYNIAVNGQATGPFDMQTIAAMAASGQINATTQVWSQGMVSWTQAGSIPEIAALFSTQMPPPPAN